MTEHKFTDEEIKKALECCKKDDCDNCPNNFGNCYANLAGYALDIINRQQAEIERLTVNMNAFGLGMIREKQRADTARAEAIKEFVERLKEKPIKYGLPLLGLQTKSEIEEYFDGIMLQVRDAIDNLVKEMTEEADDV